MPNLLLAVAIADLVSQAQREGLDADPHTLARELLARHPEAEATQAEVARVLADEGLGAPTGA